MTELVALAVTVEVCVLVADVVSEVETELEALLVPVDVLELVADVVIVLVAVVLADVVTVVVMLVVAVVLALVVPVLVDVDETEDVMVVVTLLCSQSTKLPSRYPLMAAFIRLTLAAHPCIAMKCPSMVQLAAPSALEMPSAIATFADISLIARAVCMQSLLVAPLYTCKTFRPAKDLQRTAFADTLLHLGRSVLIMPIVGAHSLRLEM